MHFSMQLPTDRVEAGTEFCTQDAIAIMARQVEEAGFEACYVTEHPFPSDSWLERGGHHAMDPFVSLTAAAMATEHLRLHSNILVLPYRNPFITAKAVASLDLLSGGRVIMGVAAGYLKGEYQAVGAKFDTRNDAVDEALLAIKQAWSGQSVQFKGRSFEATGNTMLPAPLQKPHPPIWVGGNSKLAIRRTVELADGWSPFPVSKQAAGRTNAPTLDSLEALGEKIDYLKNYAEQIGRTKPVDICFVPFGHGMNSKQPLEPELFIEQIEGLRAIGVNWLAVGMHAKTRAQYCEWVQWFGSEVIARL
ncbi:MAG: LLM class F420-dependent oxidoreductase [Halieaceae bacterium]|jgi:probable F420-dependent oxidoreductase|nr:LLM class F420-dependent oxidoreductase [Halieaceae bacterium]